MKRISSFHCLLFLLALLDSAGQSRAAGRESPLLRKIGKITHPPITEASGLVKSRTHRNVFWTVADSGNPPHLYAIERSGKLIAEFRTAGAINIDWESLAIDDRGHLFVGDVGNNIFPGGLGLRWVYRIKEPNPRVPPPQSPEENKPPVLRVEKTYFYFFPDKPFDVEAMFWRKGRLFLIEKVRKAPVRLFRLPLKDQATPIALVEVGQLPQTGMVTGASISEDGRRLAICGYRQATIYNLRPAEPIDKQLKTAVKRITFKKNGIESCCWNSTELLMVSEDRSVYSANLSGLVGQQKECKTTNSAR